MENKDCRTGWNVLKESKNSHHIKSEKKKKTSKQAHTNLTQNYNLGYNNFYADLGYTVGLKKTS